MVKQVLLTLSKENPVYRYILLTLLLMNSFTYQSQAQQMVCNDQVNVSLDFNCQALMRPDMILEGPIGQYGPPFTITIAAVNVINNNTNQPIITGPGLFKVTVSNSNGNKCWGQLLVEDKLPPLVEDCACPPGNSDESCRFLCTETDEFYAGTLSFPTPLVNENCTNYTTLTSDQEITVGLPCGAKIIRRTWVFTDAYGNVSAPCISEYYFAPIDLTVNVAPPDPNVQMTCGVKTEPQDVYDYFFAKLKAEYKTIYLAPPYNYSNAAAEAQAIQLATQYAPYYAWPTVNGEAIGIHTCNILTTKSDTEVLPCGPSCSNSKKVIRTWTVVDWCNGTTRLFTQLIKATDDQGPTVIVDDFTVSVDPWVCAGNFILPHPRILHDNCDDKPTYTVQGPLGTIITFDPVSGKYQAINAPKGLQTFNYIGSDCCGNKTTTPVLVNVLDLTPPVAVAKQNIIISLTTSGEGDGIAKLFSNSVDNGSYDSCTPVHIEIRREKDLTRDDNGCGYTGNFTYNDDGHSFDGSPSPGTPDYDPDFGAYVKFCCDDLTNTEGTVGYGIVKVWMRVWDDGNMSGKYGDIVGGQPDNYNEIWVNVRVEDKLTPKIVCPANVTINCEQDAHNLTLTGTAFGLTNCRNLEVEYTDREFFNACKTGYLLRTWRIKGINNITCVQRIDVRPSTPFSGIIQWPLDRTTNCSVLNFNDKPTWASGPCDQVGVSLQSDTFYFEAGACMKILNKWTVINWCVYDPNSSSPQGIYTHTQTIKVVDVEKPTLGSCDNLMFEINDHGDADNDGNKCETKNLMLTKTATDQGICASNWLKWVVLVDLWGDGTYDYEFSSFLPAGDASFNDTNGNGIPDRYVGPTGQGGEIKVTIPEDIVGSMSNHKVSWRVTDGCGNYSVCEQNFMVVDKKKPTPYCKSISSALMINGTVELWAVDFNVGSFDNCTSASNLMYTFDEMKPVESKLNEIHIFKGNGVLLTGTTAQTEYAAGRAQKWIPASKTSGKVFNCIDHPETSVKMTVWDQKFNYDFCIVTLQLADNQNACGNGLSGNVTGSMQTVGGKKLPGVTAVLSNMLPEMVRSATSNEEGNFIFTNVPFLQSYELQAVKNDDHSNGVSTLDLVLSQRHILGIDQLNNPYKVIAADINKDDKINSTDLVELRKLILGLITELPNNGSWRFIDAQQTFANVNYPWPLQEKLFIQHMENDVNNMNFISVKVGDVNISATTNAKENVLEGRTSFEISAQEIAVDADEVVMVEFTANESVEMHGFQFTMDLKNAELLNIWVDNKAIDASYVAQLGPNTYTVSWNGLSPIQSNSILTLEVKALKSGNISEMIQMHSNITNAEIYHGAGLETNKLSLKFANVSQQGFVLFQNEPNPFQDITNIQFNLPEAGDATLTILDVTGKVLLTRTGTFGKGLQSFQISSTDLSHHGVMIYKIESGQHSATAKMIGLE
ncbi:MAG: T9SS type A sorting domain-containing protein [Saprospiraceae bacterium]